MIIKKKINNHYNKLIKKYGENKSGLGWRNNGLKLRYEIFFKNLNFKNKSVLDFGCGFCDLFYFLKKKKLSVQNYVGYEINPKIIDIVKKKDEKIRIINRMLPKRKFDIVISNGVHNFNYKLNKKVIFSDLKKIINISDYGLGISFLNSDVDYKENYLFYHNEKEILNFIKDNYNCSIKVDRSFSKYETFIIAKKK